MKSNNGFTFTEVLIAFSIFLIIAALIPRLIQLLSYEQSFLQQTEASLFIQQLTLDLQKAATVNVDNQTLYLQQSNNELVTYGYFQQRIRRQVNGKGQEIVFQKVAEVKFTSWKNGIEIWVKDIFQQTYEARITHFLPLKDMRDA